MEIASSVDLEIKKCKRMEKELNKKLENANETQKVDVSLVNPKFPHEKNSEILSRFFLFVQTFVADRKISTVGRN